MRNRIDDGQRDGMPAGTRFFPCLLATGFQATGLRKASVLGYPQDHDTWRTHRHSGVTLLSQAFLNPSPPTQEDKTATPEVNDWIPGIYHSMALPRVCPVFHSSLADEGGCSVLHPPLLVGQKQGISPPHGENCPRSDTIGRIPRSMALSADGNPDPAHLHRV